jgi:hypothetical protein
MTVKVPRSRSALQASLFATEVGGTRTEGFQGPWVHDWIFCSSSSLLHLREACLVSVIEFTAGSGQL